MSDTQTIEYREQRDHDGYLYLYVTISEGIEVAVERYRIDGDSDDN